MKAFKDIELSKEEIEELIKKKEKVLSQIEKGDNYIKELSEIALLQIEINEFNKAEDKLDLCLNHFKNLNDKLGIASVYGLMATLNLKKGDYKDSIEFYQKAQDIYNKLSQKAEVIICLKGIGNAKMKMHDLEDAAVAFFECSELASKENDIYGLLDCLGSLIQIYEKKESWEIVSELYLKTLKAFQELDDRKGIITSFFNLGIIKKNESKYGKALEYFKEGTNEAIDANYAESIIRGLSYVGETLFYLGKINEAKIQYIKALNIAEKYKAQNAIIQIKVILKSLGLSDDQIETELSQYRNNREDGNSLF
ncbi:MAG: tetratricopeptide repeat protein [Promethearchaeota archaeon]|nr:MAG: tetratricopeptide repeat protein [Candidatus Lokiarchaeota archaeon]